MSERVILNVFLGNCGMQTVATVVCRPSWWLLWQAGLVAGVPWGTCGGAAVPGSTCGGFGIIPRRDILVGGSVWATLVRCVFVMSSASDSPGAYAISVAGRQNKE